MKKIFDIFFKKINAFRGVFLLRKICRRNRNFLVVFIGGFGIGDACLEASLLDSFQAKEERKVLVVCCNNQKGIIERICGVKVLGISKKQANLVSCCYKNQFTNYYCLYLYKKYRLCIADPWYYIKWPSQYIENLYVINIIRDAAFRLIDYDYEIKYPVSNSNSCVNKVDSKKNYIILNPYSNSMDIDNDFFAVLAAELLQRGYVVYTNVFGEQQEIKNTLRLECSIDELYQYAKEAYCVISIRSGILDYIVSNTKCMFVLYDDLKFYNLYSLNQWKTSCNIFEYRYREDNKKDIISLILEEIQKL